MRHFRFSLLLVPLAISVFATNSYGISYKDCIYEAKAPLEKAYCEILKKSPSTTLPPFHSFRRNPESTQRLLLTSPARKAGVTLPESKKASNNEFKSNAKPAFKNEGNGVTPEAAGAKPRPSASQKKGGSNKGESKKSEHHQQLSACTLADDKISCPQGNYFLTINIPLRRLDPRVLSDQNMFVFRPKYENENELQYLSNIYPYYLEKMLLIGLGDSTISFTKFNAIYQDANKQGENFRQRFSQMYEMLKQERQSMATKKRYRENYPESMAQCMRVSNEIISCDNIDQNWVYRRLKS